MAADQPDETSTKRPTSNAVIQHAIAIQQGRAPLPPIAQFLGLRLSEVRAGEVSMTLDADERYANPVGALHGGILCDLGDAAMGTAFATTCEDGQSYATIEIKCNFLRPVWKAHLTARAKVIHRGKTLGLAECEIVDEQQRLIAKLSSTLMVLSGERASNRIVDHSTFSS